MHKLTIIVSLFMSFQLFAGSKVDCSKFAHSVEFMKVEVKKYPHETLNFAIEADENCSLKRNPKVLLLLMILKKSTRKKQIFVWMF